jgi:hypothetical protein
MHNCLTASNTDIVFVLGLLVLHKQLEAFLTDDWLIVAAAAVLAGLLATALLLGLIRLARHLALTVGPDDGHAALRVADVPDLVCKVRVRLVCTRSASPGCRGHGVKEKR